VDKENAKELGIGKYRQKEKQKKRLQLNESEADTESLSDRRESRKRIRPNNT
jgi:hypothetical protein